MSVHDEFDRALRVHQQGKLREAFLRYDAILKAEPAFAPALHYSGVVLFQSGKLPEAAERIRAALQIDPSTADAWSNLALVLNAAGRREAAVNALKEAARRAPASAEILANLAGGEASLARWADAEISARKAVAADPQHAAGWYNLAQALMPQGRALEALDAATRAAGIATAEPTYAGLKSQIEASVGMVDKARATLEHALARKPTDTALRFDLASLLERHAEPAVAAEAFAQVLSIDPKNGGALSQLLFLRQKLGDWHDLTDLRRRFRAGVSADVPLLSPFVLLSQPSTRADQRRCAEAWTRALVGSPIERGAALLSADRLRIAYLSSDFHAHATAFLAAGLFEQHDRSRFEVIAYSTGRDDRSPIRARLVKAFDHFVDVAGQPPEQVGNAIRRDRIDILVDLKGHTEGAPPDVLALRLAPIQVHYLGYPGTLGGRLVDYLIGDPVVTPPAHAADYSEALALLPHSYQINDRMRPITEPPSRAALGLPPGAIVLCCFNSTYKLNPEVLDAWTRILKQVPTSVLWLLVRSPDEPAVANLQREIGARGIDSQRLVFATARPNAEYLGLYRHADLFLDTWPYNAHTTASDSLWAGCPLITLRGETFAGRVAASLLSAVGLPQLVCDSVDAYVTTAVQLAQDPDGRRRLRAYLDGPGRASPLFDTAATTRALEAAYTAMAEQYRRHVRQPIQIASV